MEPLDFSRKSANVSVWFGTILLLAITMGNAGAGKLGNYSFCSISSRVTGRFKPEEWATPHIGEIAQLETVEEERIEVVLPREILKNVVEAIKAVHPYEEVSIDVYQLESM